MNLGTESAPPPAYQNTFGSTAGTNPHTQKVEDTAAAYARSQQEYADSNNANQRQAGAEASKVTADANAPARADYARQQAELDRINEEFKRKSEQSGADADELLRMQHDIASRQANITAAKAGQSGLVMAESDIQGVKDDAISKFGNNITNAMDFRNKTKMSLNDAVAAMAKDINLKKGDITKALQGLTDKETAPVLSAIAAAATGNQEAAAAVRDFVGELQKKKATEEYNRMSRTQRIEDTNDEYQKAPLSRKISLVMESLTDSEENGGVGAAGGLVTQDVINNLISKYPAGTPLSQIISQAKALALKQQTYITAISTKMAQGQALTPKEKAFWDKFGNQVALSQGSTLDLGTFGNQLATQTGTIQSQRPTSETGMNIPSNQSNAPIEQKKAKTGGGKAVDTKAVLNFKNVSDFVAKNGRDGALRKINAAFNKGMITQAQYQQAVKAIG